MLGKLLCHHFLATFMHLHMQDMHAMPGIGISKQDYLEPRKRSALMGTTLKKEKKKSYAKISRSGAVSAGSKGCIIQGTWFFFLSSFLLFPRGNGVQAPSET